LTDITKIYNPTSRVTFCAQGIDLLDIYGQRPQSVVDHEFNEQTFHQRCLQAFTDATRDSEKGRDFKGHFESQGINFSHEINVPILDEVARVVGLGTPTVGEFVNDQVAAEQYTNFGLLGKLASSGLNILGSIKFWLVLLAFLMVTTHNAPKKFVRIVRFQKFILMMLMLIVLYDETFGSHSRKTRLLAFRDYFWVHLAPMLQQLDNVVDDDGIELEPVFERPNREHTAPVPTHPVLHTVATPMFVPQGISDSVPEIASVITALLSFSIGYKVKDKFSSSIMNMMKVTPVTTSNLTVTLVNFFNSFSGFMKSIGNDTVADYFYIDMVRDPIVSDFMMKSTDFINNTSNGQVLSSAFYTEVYTELIRSGESVILSLDKNGYEYRIVMENLKKLRESGNLVARTRNALNGNRIEPVGIMIKGKPGCMKGVFCERLATAIAQFTLPEPWVPDFELNKKDFIYSSPNDKFFEGYTYKAWITIMDDLFQIRDAVGDPESEAVKVIKMINSAEYPLPMANISEKNSVFFRSQFVMATSNRDSYNGLESIFDSKAVERRFHLDIRLEISPNYRGVDGKTLHSKLPRFEVEDESFDERLVGTSIPEDFWNISMRITRGNDVGQYEPVTFEQVLDMAIDTHQEHVKHFYINKAMETDFNTKLMAKRELRRGKFSNLAYRTFVPQSGLTPGSFPVEESFDIKSKFMGLSQEERREFYGEYYTRVVQLGVPCLIQGPVTATINRHLSVLDEEKRIRITSEWDNRPEFMRLLILSMETHYSKGIDALTGAKIRVPSKLDTVLNKIKNKLTPICNFINENKLAFFVGIPLFLGSVHYLNKFFKSFVPTGQSEAQSFDPSRDRAKVGKPVKGLRRYMGAVRLNPQSPMLDLAYNQFTFPTIDPDVIGPKSNNSDVMAQILNKYHFMIQILRNKNGVPDVVKLGSAFNVRGRIFAMPLHFIYQFNDVHAHPDYSGASVRFSTVTNSSVFICSLEDLLKSFKASVDSCNNDVCLVEVPGAHPTSKGMIKHFLKNADVIRLRKCNSFRASVVGVRQNVERRCNILRSSSVNAYFTEGEQITANWETHGDPVYMLESTVRYEGEYFGGECGSICSVDGKDFENRIVLGMHVAGFTGSLMKYGLSNVMTQENMEKLMSETFPDAKIFVDEERISHLSVVPLEAQGLLKPYATLPPSMTPGSMTKTNITRSRLFGKLPPPYDKVENFPARLSPFLKDGLTFDPIKEAHKKYAKEPIYYPHGFVKKAVASYENQIMNNMSVPGSSRRKIELKEALHAFEEVRGIASSTSAGYPMTLSCNENVKKLYYQAVIDGDELLVEIYYQRIAKLVDDVMDTYKKGIRPAWFYKGFAKDELRPLEKVVKNPSTRLCSASAFILLVVYRMYFGAFISEFFKANVNVGSAIGINPYQDWDAIARKMLRFSNIKTESVVGAGDYKGFDTCERPEVLWEILELINRWYGHDHPDNLTRKQLWAEIINSRHVFGNEVYEWATGMPSGNPLTSIINTMYNNITFRIAFQFAGFKADEFNENVALVCLGDDNLFSTSPSYRDVFNEVNMPEFMEPCGMVYTTELKEKATERFRPIQQVEFLKRSFRYDDSFGKWVAPMRISALYIPLNWTKKGVESDQITVDQITSTIAELSLHGRSVFNKHARSLHDLRAMHYPNCKANKELTLDYDFVIADTLHTDFLY
jgi:hypothetical protein